MNTFIIISSFIVWWAIGYYSFKYFWLKHWDFTASDRAFGLMIGTTGIIALWATWLWHSGKSGEVITKKKGGDK